MIERRKGEEWCSQKFLNGAVIKCGGGLKSFLIDYYFLKITHLDNKFLSQDDIIITKLSIRVLFA